MDQRDRDIYEWGELERDAERTAQFTTVGGFFHRVFMWIARVSREEREALRAERDEDAAPPPKPQETP